MTVVTKPKAGEVEQRSAPSAELTIEGNRLCGLIPYGIESRDLGGWTEVIEPGALAGADMSDLVATLNHAGIPLGRFDSTLTIEDRDDGLSWSCELPEGPTGQDVRAAVERGDLRESSWRMVVGKDSWTGTTRRISEIRSLRDVAVVTTGAYPADATRVELRERPEPPAPTPPNPQETEVKDRENRGGGLVVEDRAADLNPDIETRIYDAMRGVPKGESRSLTLASADPVEPEDLSQFVFDLLREPSVLLRSGVPVIATNRKEWVAPTITGDVDADWVGEAEEIPASDPTLSELKATPRKVAQRVIGSSEAFDDSSPDLMRLVQQNLATALALKIDKEGIVGNSSKGFKGLTTISGTQTLNMGEAVLENYDPLVAAVALLAEANVPGPYAILMHPRHAASLDRLREVMAVAGEEGPELIVGNAPLGRPEGLPPIYVTPNTGFTAKSGEKVDRAPIVVYSPSQLAMIRRKEAEMVVDRSAEFDTDEVVVRAIARCCLTTAYPQSICVIKDVAAPKIEL